MVEDYIEYGKENGDASKMGSDIYFYGLAEGETSEVQMEEGKVLVIKLLEIGRLEQDGNRTLYFEVNDSRRAIKVKDCTSSQIATELNTQMANPDDETEIGANIPGNITKILVKAGDEVKENQTVIIIEAMKMETNVVASVDGVVDSVSVDEGQAVEVGQLLINLK